ncbi:hypothetical protein B7R87_00785 [Streptomyces tsukubensis]|nr:hypothetical protein B7R87_00785 [Streptomyces tsukubensis]
MEEAKQVKKAEKAKEATPVREPRNRTAPTPANLGSRAVPGPWRHPPERAGGPPPAAGGADDTPPRTPPPRPPPPPPPPPS